MPRKVAITTRRQSFETLLVSYSTALIDRKSTQNTSIIVNFLEATFKK